MIRPGSGLTRTDALFAHAHYPYGVYVLKDDSEVLFYRSYQPIAYRDPTRQVITPKLGFVENILWNGYFYDGSCAPYRASPDRAAAARRCQLALHRFLTGGDVRELFFSTNKSSSLRPTSKRVLKEYHPDVEPTGAGWE